MANSILKAKDIKENKLRENSEFFRNRLIENDRNYMLGTAVALGAQLGALAVEAIKQRKKSKYIPTKVPIKTKPRLPFTRPTRRVNNQNNQIQRLKQKVSKIVAPVTKNISSFVKGLLGWKGRK